MKKIWIELLSFLLLGIAGSTSSFASTLPGDTDFYSRYPFIRIVDYDAPANSFTDTDFFYSAAKVVFPVSKYNLPSDSPFLRELENVVLPRVNSDSMQFYSIVMRGAASPEGPYSFNKRLGEQRAKSLLNFLTERLKFPVAPEVLKLDNDVEDYRSLCMLMRNNHDVDYETVQQLCDQYMPSNKMVELKQKLKLEQGGRLWQRLLKEYFPQLRTARVMLCFRRYAPPVETIEIEEPQDTVPVEPIVPTVPEEVLPDTMTVVDVTPPPAVPTDTLTEVIPRREMLSLKTNLLLDFAYMPGYDRWCPIPNIALEYYPKRGHFTYGFSFDMPWWQDYKAHKFFQVRNYQVETRYYLKTNHTDVTSGSYKAPAFSGFYLQGYAHAGVFGICFDANRGWVGEGAGGGIGAGYVMPISRNGHWRLEFGVQAGFFRCKYDPYKYENPVNPAYHDDLYYYKWTGKPEFFKKRQYRWNWLGPTRVGITLTYDLLYRRIQKKGVSFKSTERRTAYE